MHADLAANTFAHSAAEASQAEQAEVSKFINQQTANSGLHAVASGLLEKLLGTGSVSLSPEVMEGVMVLKAAVQGELSMQIYQANVSVVACNDTAALMKTAGHAQQPLSEMMQEAYYSQACCMATTDRKKMCLLKDVLLFGRPVLQAGSALLW